MKRLQGRVALITGAGAGIGKGLARRFAAEGASLWLADINAAAGESAAAEIRSEFGVKVGFATTDVSERAAVQDMVGAAQQHFGRVDILVNNAALMIEAVAFQIDTIPIEQWEKVMHVNTTGALICAQSVIPSMRARGGGRIINQTSGGAFPAKSVYGISKLALVGLTTSLAKQLGKDNITANAIAPGNVTSEAGSMLVPPDSPFAQYLASMVCTKAQGAPDELVGTLLLLCSEAGQWITGQTIHVDGGWVIRP